MSNTGAALSPRRLAARATFMAADAITVGKAATLRPCGEAALRAIRVGPTDIEIRPIWPGSPRTSRPCRESGRARGEGGAKVICDGRGARVEGAPNGSTWARSSIKCAMR